MPAPATLARRTPAPASSSRQRPADSVSVMSTVSALNASRRDLRPANVTNDPVPLSSIFKSRSLPFCAPIEASLSVLELRARLRGRSSANARHTPFSHAWEKVPEGRMRAGAQSAAE
jgi:hypothetical protein